VPVLAVSLAIATLGAAVASQRLGRDGGVTVAAPPKLAPAHLIVPYGPLAATAPAVAASVPAYLGGGASAAAVVVTSPRRNPDAARTWLTEAGVPSVAARGVADAVSHPFVVLVGAPSAKGLARLARFVRDGGTLVVDAPATPGLRALAGVGTPRSAPRAHLAILPGGGMPSADVYFRRATTTGFAHDHGALARFADGSAAIAARRLGAGLVVLTGVPLEYAVTAVQAGDAAPTGGRDALVLLARILYGLRPTGVALGAAPDGAASAVVLTHDLTTPAAYAAAPAVAALERDRGVHATFFASAQTHGAPGAAAALTAASTGILRRLGAGGAEVGSAGIVDTPFAALAPGSGNEAYPGYAPTIASGGATQLGELRVSRHIVASLASQPVPAFRPQDGEVPAAALARLAAVGYTVDASPLASTFGGGTPFRPRVDGGELPLLRLPLGFDDATGGRLDRRVDELVNLATRTRELGAPLAVRVSPTSGSVATYALETVLARLADDVWVGSAGAFAASFSARYGLTLDVTADQETAALAIHLVAGGRVASQTLILPSPAASATLRATGARLTLSPDGRRISVPAFTNSADVDVVVRGK
jgi:peptidoglycan/xylan/chitin deacetylase (PgdA/CDA1 family)